MEEYIQELEALALADGFDTTRVNLDDDPAPDRLYFNVGVGLRGVNADDGAPTHPHLLTEHGWWATSIDLAPTDVDGQDVKNLAKSKYAQAMASRPTA